MLEQKFHMPTQVLIGRDTVEKNGKIFTECGKNALVVTGQSSGVKSGALADVEEVLKSNGMEYTVFDKIINNPDLENIGEAGELARKKKCDFIVAIGGGSPLDAAKAVAIMAVSDISAQDIFSFGFNTSPLPVIAIPTTCGTGSEVTPYSILTCHAEKTKKNLSHPLLFPKVAFLDAKYLENLPHGILVNTAVDAFSHSLEGYLSKRSTEISDLIALEGIRIFGECLPCLKSKSSGKQQLESLLYASALGGMVIAQTGTTIVHSMGYNLTYFDGFPHGLANGVLLAEYLRFSFPEAPEKIGRALDILGLGCIDNLKKELDAILEYSKNFTSEQLKKYAEIAVGAKNLQNTPRIPTVDDEYQIYCKSLLN